MMEEGSRYERKVNAERRMRIKKERHEDREKETKKEGLTHLQAQMSVKLKESARRVRSSRGASLLS